ncbi:hypothetical protein OPV22_003771 [Ensete ventricosum]|nr:hypothetical protein OPV22_003771 [Ensete ventricosum]RWW72703.1 hypothetical protein BHE74_00019490 [Ensete ventricosum]
MHVTRGGPGVSKSSRTVGHSAVKAKGDDEAAGLQLGCLDRQQQVAEEEATGIWDVDVEEELTEAPDAGDVGTQAVVAVDAAECR